MVERRPRPWAWITELLQTSARKPEERKIGIEIERIGIWPDGSTLHYADRISKSGEKRPGAGSLLNKLDDAETEWAVVTNEKRCPLGFSTPLGKVSLEPGSQVELSTYPLEDIPTIVENVKEFDSKVAKIAEPWGLKWIGLGINPAESVGQLDVIPSSRYDIMTEYLGRRGKLGTSMMRLTTSVQINLDYTSEAEGIEMLRVALAATPVSYALFGNSPLMNGKETGYLSYRRQIWRDTDPDRTGLLHGVFDPAFDFDHYAQLIWKQPLMFVQNEGKGYVAANGLTLDDLSKNKLESQNVAADETNQINAIRELFTEARLKPGYLEVRSVDGLRSDDRYAATAFWAGLLYDADARQFALELTGKLSAEAREQATLDAAREGLKAKIGNRSMKDVASALAEAAKKGLQARGKNEARFLEPVFRTLEDGLNPAERVLKSYNGEWKKQIAPLVAYSAN